MNRIIIICFFFCISHTGFSQTADFTFTSSNGLFCTPSTIQFTQTCTGTPTAFIWDFGNNTFEYTINATYTYIQAGTYSVTLTAIYDQSAVSITKSIVINPINTPLITVDRDYICMPGIINFNAAGSGNITNYEWDFGDTSGLANTLANNTSHSYGNYATYSVELNVTDNFGCVGNAKTTVMVKKLPISAGANPTQGCIPATPSFSANVTVPINDVVSNYTWDFGDASPPVSTGTNTTTHLYNAVGSYLPVLTVSTNAGCTNVFNYPPIAYGTPPLNHVAYAKKSVVCGSETPEFVSKATNANSYTWNFGDGTIQTVFDTLTKHKYLTLGRKGISVTPFFNGCAGNTIDIFIDVVGVISRYAYTNTCTNKQTFSFNNTSQGNLSIINWDFDDFSPMISTRNAVHTFPIPGAFTPRLTVTDTITGCSDTYSRPIYTASPMMENADSFICRNTTTTFSILNNYANPGATYKWDIVGKKINSGTNASVTIKADILGNFSNSVIISNGAQFCPDTIKLGHPILVRGPALDFTSPAKICFNDLYNVTNNSKPFIPADSVVLWYWNFGASLINDTIYQPKPYNYPGDGLYFAKLIALDINGCKDSLVKPIRVRPIPFLKVLPRFVTICAGRPDTLIAFHSDSLFWSPANTLSCSTCDTVLANPLSNTTYYITAKSTFNCSITDSIQTRVYAPFTAKPSVADYFICVNEQVVLDMDPKLKLISWSPTTGLSNPTIYNPTASPLQTTTYTATLSDSVGCFTSAADVRVFVKSVPSVDAGPDKIYPYNSNFTISPVYSNNTKSYLWTPSSLLNCNNCANPSGVASLTQTYSIKVTSDSGCVASDIITIGIECKNANLLMPSAFTPNNDNKNDVFYPLTRGVKTITKFLIYNRAGQVLFEGKNFPPNESAFGWDGRYKGINQSEGAYVYVLKALCEVGETISKSGSFILLR